MTGCSSITESLDISSIIDKTESWLFDYDEEKKKKSENELNDENSENTLEREEEVFPDINDIPQEKPEFDQIDEEFFANDKDEVEDILIVEENNSVRNNEIATASENSSLSKNKNVQAISMVRENIRRKLSKLFFASDPPVNRNVNTINNDKNEKSGEKIAIIQFPNNSVIPDDSADLVLNEISKIKTSKKIKLVGHASKIGSDTISGKRRNMEISIARAQTIKNILVKKGFDEDKIVVTGKGDLEPLQGDTEKYGEAANRRVEIFFISD